MSNIILRPDDFGLKLFQRFPSFYQIEDALNKNSLRRYLDALAEGGFKPVIQYANGLLDLYDPSNTDAVFLPALFEQFGLDVYEGIPEAYLRFLLPRLGESWSKKGTLPVIDFVVTALSNLKTETTTEYDAQGVPNVTVRIEMDYEKQGEFPDPYQFARLLRKYLPYYVDSTLVYVYVFYEATRLYLKETFFRDKIKHDTSEFAFIPYGRGSRPYPELNAYNVRLNDNFVLNGHRYFPIDTDSRFDAVKWLTSETAGIHHKLSQRFYAELLNNPGFLLNRNFVLNEWVENDVRLDRVVYVPAHDVRRVHVDDVRHDFVRIDSVFTLEPLTNTRRVLNKDFILNSGNADIGEIRAVDSKRTDAVSFVQKETGRIRHDVSLQYYRGETNDPYKVLNRSFVLNAFADTDAKHDLVRSVMTDAPKVNALDSRHDRVSLGSSIVYPPMLNSVRRLNFDFRLNASNIETGEVKAVESRHDLASFGAVNDEAGINGKTSNDLYRPVLCGVARLCVDLALNERLPVDTRLDAVKTVTHDNQEVSVRETLREDYHFEVNPVFAALLNTRFRLNRDFRLNSSNGDVAEVRMIEGGVRSDLTMTCSESAALHFNSSMENRMGMFTNVPESVLNDMVLSVPDIIDVVFVRGVRKVVYVTPRVCVGL